MKSTAPLIVAALCCLGGSAPSAQPGTIDAAKTINLRPGESAMAGDGSVRVGFDGVVADSRCAIGEQCVWAGDATVGIWLQRGAGPKELRQLHTAAGTANAAQAFDHEVRLLRLDPEPRAGSAVMKQDYRLTLTLARRKMAQPDR